MEDDIITILKWFYQHTKYLQDRGPEGEGWQSEELIIARKAAKNIIDKHHSAEE